MHTRAGFRELPLMRDPLRQGALSSIVRGYLHLLAVLGVFMSFLEEIRDQGGDIKLAAITPKVFQVFDVLGFPQLFDITGSVETAVARFSQPQGA